MVLLSFNNFVHSQKVSSSSNKKEWFETISVGGYLQVRYNRLFETNPNLGCEQCDKSWGDGGGFFIRRARMKFSGNLNKRVYFYIQPDFASSLGTDKANFAQIKDAYFDISLDEKNEYRFRVGQSKVPFGFENMQSSQNRLPLDRADPTNSAVKDFEIGVEWQPFKNFELVAEYTFSNRRYEDFKNQNNHQQGSLVRLQAQINF